MATRNRWRYKKILYYTKYNKKVNKCNNKKNEKESPILGQMAPDRETTSNFQSS